MAHRRDKAQASLTCSIIAGSAPWSQIWPLDVLSDILTEEGAQSFLDLCPHSEYVNVTGAGHMVAGDRNDAFTEAVADFLDRRRPVVEPQVEGGG